MPPRLATYTTEEVLEHNSAKSQWLIVNGKVYDVTVFQKEHPGGAAVLLQHAGKDATAAAEAAHQGSEVAAKRMKKLCIGSVLHSTANKGSEDPWAPNLASDGEISQGRRDSVTSASSKLADISDLGDLDQLSDVDDESFYAVLVGEDALVAVASIVYQYMRNDPRLAQFIQNHNVKEFASELRFFLVRAFDGAEWPVLHVSPAEVETSADRLVTILLDALRLPLPLGQDVLVGAMSTLNKTFRDDSRVITFFEEVASWSTSPLGLDETHNGAAPQAQLRQYTQLAPAEVLPRWPKEDAASVLLPQEAGRDHDANEHIRSVLPSAASTSPPSAPSIPSLAAVHATVPEAVSATLNHQGARERVGISGINLSGGIETETFSELHVDAKQIADARDMWQHLIVTMGSREAVGEAIYGAVFEAAPSLQALFTTPRAVQAVRFMETLSYVVNYLDNPSSLKGVAETIGFGHLHMDLTVARVVIFRDAILDLFAVELSEELTTDAREIWRILLNYIGGALIYVKNHYATRLKILAESWESANSKKSDSYGATTMERLDGTGIEEVMEEHKAREEKVSRAGYWKTMVGMARRTSGKVSENGEGHDHKQVSDTLSTQDVPTTFPDMFRFNAEVMGFGVSNWMNSVLECFDRIVRNASNPIRLQEECEVLALRISKLHSKGSVKLWEFKSCMLASLRSLLPASWSPDHELAWTWLWENIDRILTANMNNPSIWQKALVNLFAKMDEDKQYQLRTEIYAAFFRSTPIGEQYFNQSDTRLHYIAQRVLDMSQEIFEHPARLCRDLSALGLRHVGYGIPTELFSPFVTSCIEVVMTFTRDEVALAAFRWSLSLIAKIIVRTITEGSTLVMKAITANSTKQLIKAISYAPRCNRANSVLCVQVGTQSISPLIWAIESGSFDAARTIIEDLLTIRSDREQYYYGVDELFKRHPDIVQRLCLDAPVLMEPFLDGLIWRSRNTHNGMRRVNYYVKHLLVSNEGRPAFTLKYIAVGQDLKIISHCAIVKTSDLLWFGVVGHLFWRRKIWVIVSLAALLLSQAVLPNLIKNGNADSDAIRWAILVGRMGVYSFTVTRLAFTHAKMSFKAYHRGETVRVLGVKLPTYLRVLQNSNSLILLIFLIAMFGQEPMIHCINDVGWPTTDCPGITNIEFRYSVCAMLAMGAHWMLLIDLAIFSTEISAFVLVIGNVAVEVGRFLVALGFLIMTFGSALTVLQHDRDEFKDIQNSIVTLMAITLGMFETDYRWLYYNLTLLLIIFFFVTLSAIILLNLLIAQLNYAYDVVNQDMVGFARMNRAKVIDQELATCPRHTWKKFVISLQLDSPLEFNEGDVGMSGGVSDEELGYLNPVDADRIMRFGGSCQPEARWPEEEQAKDDSSSDRFENLEKLMQKTLSRMVIAKTKKFGTGGASGSSLCDSSAEGSGTESD